MKFHITDDGPKRCTASKRPCPLGGEHFNSVEEANSRYEELMADEMFSTKKKESTNVSIPLTEGTEEIVNRLSDAGIRPLLVGGYVRDHILGMKSKDIDLELYGSKPDGSTLTLDDVGRVFSDDPDFKVDETGASFSVLKVYTNGEDFDLSLPRTEKSTGEGHRDYDLEFDSTMSVEEAAGRRDFSINSLGYDPKTGELVDPYGGLSDLQTGVLRHMNPAFADDPLRVLRAVNFSSRFGFDVAPETLKLCQDLAPSYSSLPTERVEEEFEKALIKGKYHSQGLKVLYDTGWSKQMKPFANVTREEFDGIGKRLENTPPSLRRAVLARSLTENGHPDPSKEISKKKTEHDLAKNLNTFMTASENGSWGDVVEKHRTIKKKHPEISNQDLSKAFNVCNLDNSIFNKLPEEPTAGVVTGKKLIDLGHKPGPDMGTLIHRAQKIQDEESLYDFDELFRRSSQAS